MPKKIPNSVLKMAASQQRTWIADEIAETEAYLKTLRQHSRALIAGKELFAPRVDSDRPDLLVMKG